MDFSEAKRLRALEEENSRLKKLLADTMLKNMPIKDALLAKAIQYPRYGYLMLDGLLKNEGLVVNMRLTYRLHTEAGLPVRTKKR